MTEKKVAEKEGNVVVFPYLKPSRGDDGFEEYEELTPEEQDLEENIDVLEALFVPFSSAVKRISRQVQNSGTNLEKEAWQKFEKRYNSLATSYQEFWEELNAGAKGGGD